MRTALLVAFFLAQFSLVRTRVMASESEVPWMNPQLATYIRARTQEFDRIPEERVGVLKQLAESIRSYRATGKPVQLTFICTHNSRRSQLAQVWGAVSAAYFGVDHVKTFSGGTETTAFNPRAVSALERTGLPRAPAFV